jgi:hypothetical protein
MYTVKRSTVYEAVVNDYQSWCVLDVKEDCSQVETSGGVRVDQSNFNTSPKANYRRIMIIFARRGANSHTVDA